MVDVDTAILSLNKLTYHCLNSSVETGTGCESLCKILNTSVLLILSMHLGNLSVLSSLLL